MKRIVMFPLWLLEKAKAYIKDHAPKEAFWVIACGISSSANHIRMMGRQIIFPEADDYATQEKYLCRVKDKWLENVMDYCVENQLHPIICHSHPFSEKDVWKSALDYKADNVHSAQVAKLYPGMATSTMVTSNECRAFEGHIYNQISKEQEPIDMVLIPELSHLNIILPTSSELINTCQKNKENELFWSRVSLAFGEEFMGVCRHLHVGIVGCGGLGDPIAIQLANLGFDITLVDDDMFAVENVNRSYFGNIHLAEEGVSKVEILRRAILQSNPEANVTCIKGDIRNEEVQRQLTPCDLLVTTTDNVSSRFVVSHLAMIHGILFFDAGNEISVKDGKVISICGQVLKNIPGQNLCHRCADVFDYKKAREGLLSDEVYKIERERGYINDDDITAPSVIALNTYLGGMTVLEIMKYLSGVKKDTAYDLLACNMLENKLKQYEYERGEDCQRVSCPVCSPDGYLFNGDRAPFLTKAESCPITFDLGQVDNDAAGETVEEKDEMPF